MIEKDQMPPKRLTLPCLRGQVADWIYYVALVSYSELAVRFKPAEEIHRNTTLNELLQRALTKRSAEIGNYIIHQKQHFFNAIIAGIYDGEPRWIEIELGDAVKADAPTVAGAVGVLELSGEERIFAIDGQHRVEGIKHALIDKPIHGSEEAVVIFVAHNNKPSGLERTRRLFSTLNRYAKPVDLGEIIALDEDDTIAIVTRRLLYHHELLKQEHVIAPSKTKSIPTSDKDAFTSIQALYELLERVILHSRGIKGKALTDFKRYRQQTSTLDEIYKKSCTIIDLLITHFEELKIYANSSGAERAKAFRNSSGGSLLFRPVGLSILGLALSYSIQQKLEAEFVLLALSRVSRQMADYPWKGLIFDAANRKMRPRISKTDILVGSRLWLFMAELLPKSELSRLEKDYAGAMGISIEESAQWIKSLHAK